MIQLYLARDAAEAHLLTEMLGAVGIKAQVQGEHISTLQGAVPFGTATSPSVWLVDHSDMERAQKQISRFFQERQPARSARVWVCCGLKRVWF